MNSVDKKILLGVALVSGVIALRYGFTEEKGVIVPGLDVKNSKKLIAAIAILSAGILIYNELKSKKSIA